MKKLDKISNGDWNLLIQNQKNFKRLSHAWDLLDQVGDILGGIGENAITFDCGMMDVKAIENDDYCDKEAFVNDVVESLKQHIYNIEMKNLQLSNNKILGIK